MSARLVRAVVLAAAVWLSCGQGRAEMIVFESASYYCSKMGAEAVNDRQCRIAVDPQATACDHLSAYGPRYFDGEDAALFQDVSRNFCGRRNIVELLKVSQEMRYRAMSYVSLGYDETECDPARHFTTSTCNQPSFAAYYLYMGAAYRCKFE